MLFVVIPSLLFHCSCHGCCCLVAVSLSSCCLCLIFLFCSSLSLYGSSLSSCCLLLSHRCHLIILPGASAYCLLVPLVRRRLHPLSPPTLPCRGICPHRHDNYLLGTITPLLPSLLALSYICLVDCYINFLLQSHLPPPLAKPLPASIAAPAYLLPVATVTIAHHLCHHPKPAARLIVILFYIVHCRHRHRCSSSAVTIK